MRATISVAYAMLTDASLPIDQLLAPAERQRASEFKSELRREQFTVSRALARALLEQVTGEKAASFTLASDERGKPYCVDGPAVSISHSRDLVACAVADNGDIGIDVEFPGRRHDTEGIAARFFSADEAAWLATQPEDRFYMLWVLKEAWLKATGAGIAGGLDSLNCHVTPPDIEVQASAAKPQALSLFRLHDGYLGVATTTEPQATVTITRWDSSSQAFAECDDATLVAGYSAGR
jgi:4'-phosphopantetheinyl transferase